jgi:D-alanyl-D-alanine-carboxypeptidase/D-alanyl-D-alanine-endopeptidase
MTRVLVLLLVACSGGGAKVPAKPVAPATTGPHKAPVEAQLQPYIDGEILSGVVVGLYDNGKTEIYGFGKGPGGKPPDGDTLFELGSLTKIYTALMLADSVQRKEVELDTPIAELLPPGMTVPTKDKAVITLRHLALHSAGLPRLPPSIKGDMTDPYGKYTEDQLARDLIQTDLDALPGDRIVYSNYGYGLLGFGLGRKIGAGFTKALAERVLKPLALASTFVTVPPQAQARRASPTTDDLVAVPPWSFTDALAGSAGLQSSVHDQLAVITAELDAAKGGRGPLRGAMRFTQEEQLENQPGANTGLGWLIDARGRYIHNGGTFGSHSFIGFDPKAQRGVVVLAATGSSLVDRLGQIMFDVLDGSAKPTGPLPTAAQLDSYAGHYDFAGTPLTIVHAGNRLYIEGPGEPRHRLVPISDVGFFIEAVQSFAFFQKEGDAVKQIIFQIGDRQLVAARTN